MQKYTTKHIGKILSKVFPKQERWKFKLFQCWGDIIGKLKDKVRIEKIDSKKITLGVCHPAWAQELHLLSNVLKKKINEALKEEKIKEIRFKVVETKIKRALKKKEQYKDKQVKEINKKNLFSVLQQESLNKIEDKDLREFLKQYYLRCFFRRGTK